MEHCSCWRTSQGYKEHISAWSNYITRIQYLKFNLIYEICAYKIWSPKIYYWFTDVRKMNRSSQRVEEIACWISQIEFDILTPTSITTGNFTWKSVTKFYLFSTYSVIEKSVYCIIFLLYTYTYEVAFILFSYSSLWHRAWLCAAIVTNLPVS